MEPLDWLTIRQELSCTFLPRASQRKPAARFARNRQSLQTGVTEVLVEHADGMSADDVLWARHRIGRDRHARRQRLKLDDAERIRTAREHEDVGGSEVRGQRYAFQRSQEMGFRKAALQLLALGTVADHDLRPWQVERQKRGQILLDRDPPDTREDRPRQA